MHFDGVKLDQGFTVDVPPVFHGMRGSTQRPCSGSQLCREKLARGSLGTRRAVRLKGRRVREGGWGKWRGGLGSFVPSRAGPGSLCGQEMTVCVGPSVIGLTLGQGTHSMAGSAGKGRLVYRKLADEIERRPVDGSLRPGRYSPQHEDPVGA